MFYRGEPRQLGFDVVQLRLGALNGNLVDRADLGDLPAVMVELGDLDDGDLERLDNGCADNESLVLI